MIWCNSCKIMWNKYIAFVILASMISNWKKFELWRVHILTALSAMWHPPLLSNLITPHCWVVWLRRKEKEKGRRHVLIHLRNRIYFSNVPSNVIALLARELRRLMFFFFLNLLIPSISNFRVLWILYSVYYYSCHEKEGQGQFINERCEQFYVFWWCIRCKVAFVVWEGVILYK